MINVPILSVVNGLFFKDSIQYKIESTEGKRVKCCRYVAPKIKATFSLNDIVQVDDKEADSIFKCLTDVKNAMLIDLNEITKAIEMIQQQKGQV
jgi:hypothetical protein